MKTMIALALAGFAAAAYSQCNPIGWRLVEQKYISVTERLCTYEKNGVRISKMVDGLCPMDPC